jgi:hypothetical protein
MKEALNQAEIDQFITQGYVRINDAFSSVTAREAREILWKDTGCDPNDSRTWTKPVIRLGWYDPSPFVQAANSTRLHTIFNQLAGEGNWMPRTNLGTFPVRFPSVNDPGDTGWHVDGSFPGDEPDNFMHWRVNIKSKGRALLMLFLFSDVGEKDAPTRISVGSHLDVARVLQPQGESGLSFIELAEKLRHLPKHEEVLATGRAGTVYLCHPFLVHSAQPHHGTEPRFLAQPPLMTAKECELFRADGKYSAVEQAIRLGLGMRD